MSSLQTSGVIAEVTRLTKEVTRFRLRAADASMLPAFSAGAHVLVGIGPGVVRAYSLCGDPADLAHYDIAVKREDLGRGGSLALHEQGHVGMSLQISEPHNLFGLAEHAPHHVLLGGGIGLTPLLSMAHELHRRHAQFTFATFARSPEHLPFSALLEQAPWAYRTLRHFDDGAHLCVSDLIAGMPSGTHVYCCGPDGFMRAMRASCGSIPGSQWHQESFGASTEAAALSTVPIAPLASGAELHLSASNRRVALQPGQTLLEALREHNFVIDSACEQGICGSCVARYHDGIPIHRDECLDDEQRAEYVALCVAGCASPSLVLEL
jgi:vanillate O-demethylase ferredoxin subunit